MLKHCLYSVLYNTLCVTLCTTLHNGHTLSLAASYSRHPSYHSFLLFSPPLAAEKAMIPNRLPFQPAPLSLPRIYTLSWRTVHPLDTTRLATILFRAALLTRPVANRRRRNSLIGKLSFKQIFRKRAQIVS